MYLQNDNILQYALAFASIQRPNIRRDLSAQTGRFRNGTFWCHFSLPGLQTTMTRQRQRIAGSMQHAITGDVQALRRNRRRQQATT